jgi:phenylacetate-coenzyme A ligase PaaK-like adenylate-forming protein
MLPPFLQSLEVLHRNLINGALGFTAALLAYPLAERLEGRDVHVKVRALRCEMARPFAERRLRSWRAVVDTVRHAAVNVPYYRDLFARIGFDPEKLQTDPRYLEDIPYLTKDVIRAEGDRLLRHDHATVRKHVSTTGGSTGPTTCIVYDQEAADWSSAVTRLVRRGIGKRHFHSELHFASKFPDEFPWRDRLRERAKCLAMNRHNIFFASFDPAELEAMWRRISRIRPYLVHAHPSTMYQLALHIDAQSSPASAFRIFESSGELLEEYQRETIARVFRCDVVDRYGLAEVGIIAYQAGRRDRAMLVLDPMVWPEIATSNDVENVTSRESGEVGEVVITATKNHMMPLIRYRTGDLAVLTQTSRGFVLNELVGRIHDVIEIAGRRFATHYIQDVLNRIGGIKEFQIELRNRRPVLRLVPEDGARLDDIRGRIGRYWQSAMDVEFITPSELQLLGWRRKFRHLVTTPNGDAASTASSPPLVK